ncbi:MAG: 3-phosphoshikimate 1-carboxyvinyltransferase [Candidatus Riflebacteria bacterium]|jgi:3-phosphoshikimate 1-carboxyvinyltransferase|nr:3-phosphoshikimate 1-carboxyvinyltransferase [Candidatus Riflebacteria bacterium]
MLINPAKGFDASLHLPGDKSIAHRLVLISLLLKGSLDISNLPEGSDVLTSLSLVEKLGIKVTRKSDRLLLSNADLAPVQENQFCELDCMNSGTSARLLAGILAAKPGSYVITGDESLRRRPMLRVVTPLASMGAEISCTSDGTLPILISGKKNLHAIQYNNQVGSAQIKSAVLLAGLSASGITQVQETRSSRDHTERLLKKLGAEINVSDGRTSIEGPVSLQGSYSFSIPGDISSAAFFLVAAALFPGSRLEVIDVCLNPGRIKFLEVLRRMGAAVEIKVSENDWEPRGTVTIKGGPLKGTNIGAEEIPALVDELPVLAVAMAFAQGNSRVTGASELRHKESDRIANLVSQFRKTGISCQEHTDGFSITGSDEILVQAELDPNNDHRLAMAFAILACRSTNGQILKNPDCVKISFPDFFTRLKSFIHG